jgi:hypothetical protein
MDSNDSMPTGTTDRRLQTSRAPLRYSPRSMLVLLMNAFMEFLRDGTCPSLCRAFLTCSTWRHPYVVCTASRVRAIAINAHPRQGRVYQSLFLFPARHIVEADEKNPLPAAMLCDFQQIEHPQEAGLARQLRRDVRETDRFDRVHYDLSTIHRIAPAHSDVRTQPEAHAARDIPISDTFTQALGE